MPRAPGTANFTFTLDTAAPAVAISDVGGLTNSPTHTVAGTAEPGSTVVLSGGAQPSGPVAADADGLWSLGVTLAGQGAHTLTATATDAAGNTRDATVNYTLDTLPPSAPAITSTGELTNSRAQTVSGTAEGGGTVTLYDGETPLGTVQAGGDGHWSRGVTLTSGDGAHALTATATDAAGNTGAASSAATYTLDTAAPTLTGAVATAGADQLRAGQAVVVFLTASEAVAVDTATGAPTLALSNGGTAAYDAANSTATSLAFTYTVRPGDNASAPVVSGFDLNGATVRDAVGNDLNLAVTGEKLAGAPVIDIVAPTVEAVAALPGTGFVGIGGAVGLTVTMSEPVAVDTAAGVPTLALSNGGTATYDAAHSNAASLAFTYTVAAGQSTADLAVAGLDLNGATVRDTAGNAADLSGAAANPAGALQVDARAPAVAAVTTSPAAGSLGAGSTVALTVALDEAVAVDTAAGAPTLALNGGGVATYDAARSTAASLAFTYTVAAGQNAADLAVTGLALNGATIRDAAGNPADLSGAATNPAGTLAVDTAAPAAPADLGLGALAGTSGFAVRGTAEAGSTVRVFDGAAPVGTAVAGSDRAWSVALAGGLGAGTHSFTATATDAAGNLSTASPALTTTVASGPPAGAAPATVAIEAGARGTTVARTGGGDLVVTRTGMTEVLRNTDELQFIDGRLVFDPDATASQVARLYHAALGRDLDQGGLDYWSKAIEGGASLGGVAQGFLASPESRGLYGANPSDAEFVSRLYRNVLGREGDPGGQAFWTSRLGEGATRADVLVGVAASGENKAATAAANPGGIWDLDEGAAQVARIYDTVFGRLPDQGGLAFWTDALDSGGITLQELAARFMATPEYQTVYGPLSNRDFVQATYRNTLERPGDAGGVDYWTAQLGAGVSRAAIVATFSESPEHVALTAADVTASAPGQFGIKLA